MMVKLTDDTPVIILEGDEYLSSPIDRRPKFHLYHPHIALLSGIAWDHINVFPTFENYVEQFEIFISLIESSGALIYCENDIRVKQLAVKSKNDIRKIPYDIPEYEIRNGITHLLDANSRKEIPLQVFGEHNLMNLEGARKVCNEIDISDEQFYAAIASFKGAAKRLELVARNEKGAFYKDFAHSPSKLKATIHAVKQQFERWKVIACMELHTFSSLNENFLLQYHGSMDEADEAIVYFNPHTVEHKKLKPVSENQVKESFGRGNLIVVNDSKTLFEILAGKNYDHAVLLMMSSGNFDGMDLHGLLPKLFSSD